MDDMMMVMNGLELTDEDMEQMENADLLANGWRKVMHWVDSHKKALIVAGCTVCGIAMCAIGIGVALGRMAFAGAGAAALSAVTSVAVGGTLGCAAGHIAAATAEIMDHE